jgi:hypothetical protein
MENWKNKLPNRIKFKTKEGTEKTLVKKSAPSMPNRRINPRHVAIKNVMKRA